MTANPFQPAVRTQSKARIAIEGPAGSGKTMTALLLARGLVGPEGVIALVDSEHGSALKYANPNGLTEFGHDAPSEFSPEMWIERIRLAEQYGVDCLIFDSFSAGWDGPGGMLEIVDANAAKARRSGGGEGGNFSGWKDASPREAKMHDAITAARIHIIATIKMKPGTAVETDSRGKTVVRKIGMQIIQRDNVDYLFDVVGVLDHDHDWTSTKTRMSSLDGRVINRPGIELGAEIRTWLTEGLAPAAEIVSAEPRRAPAAAAPTANGTVVPVAEEPVAEESAVTVADFSCGDCKAIIEPDHKYGNRVAEDGTRTPYSGAQLIADSKNAAGQILCTKCFASFNRLPPEFREQLKAKAIEAETFLQTLPF